MAKKKYHLNTTDEENETPTTLCGIDATGDEVESINVMHWEDYGDWVTCKACKETYPIYRLNNDG